MENEKHPGFLCDSGAKNTTTWKSVLLHVLPLHVKNKLTHLQTHNNL